MTVTLPQFTTRPGMMSDDRAVVYLWLDEYRRGWFGKARCPNRTNEEKQAFFEAERSRVLWHLERGDVTLGVDADDPDIVWGLVAMTGDTVHYVMVKREPTALFGARQLFGLLLGDRLTRPCAYTSELNDLVKVNLMPRYWYLDGGWYFRERDKAT